jgi:hypothetical protein
MKKNKIYKNNYLGIETPSVEGWELTSVQTAKITHNWEAIFQMADDDMPMKDMGMKHLFQYRKYSLMSKAVVDADIEFSIIKTKLPKIWNEKTGQFEVLTAKIVINKTEYFISERKEDTHHWTFLYTKFDADYWFYIKIGVHKTELEAETMPIFQLISFFKSERNNPIVAPNNQHEISFGSPEEQSMGGAYYYPIFLKKKDAEHSHLLHERSAGNAVWNNDSTRIYFPIWANTDKGLMQQLAFYTPEAREISILQTVYSVLVVQTVEGKLLRATESPAYQPKAVVIDIEKEYIDKTIQLYPEMDTKIWAIKNRLAKATSGNWYYFLEGRDHTSGSNFIMTNVENRDDWKNPNRGEDLEISGATHADMEFMAHARQDIPMLIAEIERLKALIKN